MLETATPLFLIGCPRSGTTFTARLLNSHPEILMTNETAVFLLLDDIIRKSRTGIEAGILYGKDYHLLLGELLETNYREMIQVFYEKIAHTENRARLAYWGEKHPHMTMCLDRVERMFPDAKYIYLVRDPRDTAASIAKMRNVSFVEALSNWKVFSDLYETFVPQFSTDRLLLVRYETLVTNYEVEAARMLQWLGLPMTPEVEDFLSNYKNADAHSMTTGRNFATESVGRWALAIEEEQRTTVDDKIGDFLGRYGYAPTAPSASKMTSLSAATEEDASKLRFVCNICGSENVQPLEELDRERRSCAACGSSVRIRAVVHLLSINLFGKSLKLDDFPQTPSVRGIGLSDWGGYANRLGRTLNYTNTFFHKEPRLDITKVGPEHEAKCDFLISSDVFEHVAPPVSRAFVGARQLLAPGGFMVLTVPFTLEGDKTVEHFPGLHDFEVKEVGNSRLLYNVREDGELEIFDKLKFHGGVGSTLEFRVFCKASLLGELQQAGFSRFEIFTDDVLEYGIHWVKPWSVPLVARP